MKITKFHYDAFNPEYLNEHQKKLIKIWEAHVEHEFVAHDVNATMDTMTNSPHNINVPTLTGGVGKDEVRFFYENYFVHQMPEDMESILISRTVGEKKIVDETILSFTHSVEMDWILPNIAPTHKKVEIPLVVIVGFDKDDKIAFEHIYWDQASVLVQVGLLSKDHLPVVGNEAAKKILAPTSVCSWRKADSL